MEWRQVVGFQAAGTAAVDAAPAVALESRTANTSPETPVQDAVMKAHDRKMTILLGASDKVPSATRELGYSFRLARRSTSWGNSVMSTTVGIVKPRPDEMASSMNPTMIAMVSDQKMNL